MKHQKNKVAYVDGYVFSVLKKNKAHYKKIASEARDVWLKFGALDYKECVIDDASPKFVTFTFAKMAKTKPDEQVWFSFVTYENKKHRDKVFKEVMVYFDEKYGGEAMAMPFDMKRFAYAGFKVEVGN